MHTYNLKFLVLDTHPTKCAQKKMETAVFTEKKKPERINISIAKQMNNLEINSTVHHTWHNFPFLTQHAKQKHHLELEATPQRPASGPWALPKSFLILHPGGK